MQPLHWMRVSEVSARCIMASWWHYAHRSLLAFKHSMILHGSNAAGRQYGSCQHIAMYSATHITRRSRLLFKYLKSMQDICRGPYAHLYSCQLCLLLEKTLDKELLNCQHGLAVGHEVAEPPDWQRIHAIPLCTDSSSCLGRASSTDQGSSFTIQPYCHLT